MITSSQLIIEDEFYSIYQNYKSIGNNIKYSQVFGKESKITNNIATKLEKYLLTKGISTICDIDIVPEYRWCTFNHEEKDFDKYFNTPLFIRNIDLINRAIYDGKYYKVIMILHIIYNGWSKQKCFQALNYLLSINKNQTMNSLRALFQPVIDDIKNLNEEVIRDFLITSPGDLIQSINYWEKKLLNVKTGSEEEIRLKNNIELANAIYDRKLTLTGVIFDLAEDPAKVELTSNITTTEEPKGKVVNMQGQPVQDAVILETFDEKGNPIFVDKEGKKTEVVVSTETNLTGDAGTVSTPKFWDSDFVVTLDNINDIPNKSKNARKINVEDFLTMINPEDIQAISGTTKTWDLRKAVIECLNNGCPWLLAFNLWFNRISSGDVTDAKLDVIKGIPAAAQMFFSNVYRKSSLFKTTDNKKAKVVKDGLNYSDLRKEAIALQKDNKPWKEHISGILLKGTPNIPPMPQAGVDSLIKGWEEDFADNTTKIEIAPPITEEKSTVPEKEIVDKVKEAWEEFKEKNTDKEQEEAFKRHYKDFDMVSLAAQWEGDDEEEILGDFKDLFKDLYATNEPANIIEAEHLIHLISGVRLPKEVSESITCRNWSIDKMNSFRRWMLSAPKEEKWSDYIANKEKQITDKPEKKLEAIEAIKTGLREHKFKLAVDSFPFQKEVLAKFGVSIPIRELYTFWNEIKNESKNSTVIRDEKDIDPAIWESFKGIDTLDELHTVAVNMVGQDKLQDALLCTLKLIKEGNVHNLKAADEILTNVNKISWKDEEIHKWFNTYVRPVGTPKVESNETKQATAQETSIDDSDRKGESGKETEQPKVEKVEQTVKEEEKTTTQVVANPVTVENSLLTAQEWQDIQIATGGRDYNHAVSKVLKRVPADKLEEAIRQIMEITKKSKGKHCRKISHNDGHNLPDMMKRIQKDMHYYDKVKE